MTVAPPVTNQPVTPLASRPRFGRWLLVASLALNVLVVGALAGLALRSGGPGGRGGGNILGYLASLPTERRNALIKETAALRAQAAPLRKDARQAARERSDALLAEPFDRKRFFDAQTRLIEADGKLRLMLRDITADAAASMSADERRRFLRWRGPSRPSVDDADGEPKRP
jgi:uncharacterized membrane protein